MSQANMDKMDKNTWLRDLEKIFVEAMKSKDYRSALRAKEIIGQQMGYFGKRENIVVEELSDEDIIKLINKFDGAAEEN